MTQTLNRIQTSDVIPDSTSVVIIGGGIVGVSAALTLAERNIPVVLLEKGHIACEQSSRNLGWIRKTSRHLDDIPLAMAADELWKNMPERLGQSVGYQQSGILFLADTHEQLEVHDNWLKSVESLDLDSRLLSKDDIERRVPGSERPWAGAIFTPSDGRAEPHMAVPAMANAAIAKGATIIQNTSVRAVNTSAGRVSGVYTEAGEIKCEHVILAGGAWSRRFLGNMGVSLPTLPVVCTALRTTPVDGPSDIAVGASNFSFRKHRNGGYIVTQRGALKAPITLDHLLIGHQYLEALKYQRSFLRVSFGKEFFSDLCLKRRWKSTQKPPFEKVRIHNPPTVTSLNNEAMANLRAAYPIFNNVDIEEAWAGVIDITPDSNPIIDCLDTVSGMTLATGFSGHGFGTGPAAGQLAADLAMGTTPLIDPKPYKFSRL
ncbi:FAD-binding oxidoreductase [Alteromonas sp. 5E99-2]|uniref:NAD(P)/FAD-dependent oxidoreductase n=1 Tax=Alteromonas sp. 5E99-2 TaxID=2817683 RepID=UPI001A97E2EA|nr:FAD-binding oxidoreductase [Alteromonas sp. 5E99-2]MBO1256592.1 FAD-binding oxidoreductase [Alteromonas sp. 5E99-2]